MKSMRNIKKPVIKLGRVSSGWSKTPRLLLDSRHVLKQYSPRSQRVLVKVKQSYAMAAGSWKGHGKYLERDSARFCKGFSAVSDDVSVSSILDGWQKNADEKLHKIIVSPEYAQRIDLKNHCRNLMSQFEADTGRALEWVAIIHNNTENPHVHIALRGVDGDGKPLDVEDYLGSTLRDRSQEFITREIGPRLYPEILAKRDSELTLSRLTDTDRALIFKADENGIVRIPHRVLSDWRKVKVREQEQTRLGFLEKLDLVEKVSSESWRIDSNFRERLKQLSLREQLIKEQVPGWEFVRALEKSGVVRKRLELGEALTGRVVAADIRDPFGDKTFMLLESKDGIIYHVNQPRGVSEGRVRADDIVTLERRVVEIVPVSETASEKREFNAVQVHRDWRKCFELDIDAVSLLRENEVIKESKKIFGFSKEWKEAVCSRSEQLRSKNFNPYTPKWREDLESLRFKESDEYAWVWEAKRYLNSSQSDENRFVVGEVQVVGEQRILVKDVRDGVGRIVSFEDVGLTWPPSVGALVSISAKKHPHTEIRPTDERIAEILSKNKLFFLQNLNEDERKYVAARANTWVRWNILEQEVDGSFKIAGGFNAKTKEQILQIMRAKLLHVRVAFREDAKKQPAWLKQIPDMDLSAEALEFSRVDRIIKDIGAISHETPESVLASSVLARQRFWGERGVVVDSNFEQNVRNYLSRQQRLQEHQENEVER